MTLNNQLKSWLDKGLLKPEKIYPKDIARLILRARKDIKSARANLRENEELAYTAAYLAVLRAGRGLLFAHGYRPSGNAQHKTTFDVVETIIGEEYSALIYKIDDMRKRRNQFTYDVEFIDSISDDESSSAISDAKEFLKVITQYLKGRWPNEKEYKDL